MVGTVVNSSGIFRSCYDGPDAAYVGKETIDFLILEDLSGCFTGKDTDGNSLAGWERGFSCVSLFSAAKWAKHGKYADKALTFAGKLDDKLANTRLSEDLQSGKEEVGKPIPSGEKRFHIDTTIIQGRGYRRKTD